jgi:uncharacterized protein YfiM (DUF2279 family)
MFRLLLLLNILSAPDTSLVTAPQFVAQDTLSSLSAKQVEKNVHRGIAAYAVSNVAALPTFHKLWYEDYERTKFHWKNDCHEWKQQDKFGHAMGAYTLSRLSGTTMQMAGASKKQTAWVSFLTGITIQTELEFLDGITKGWGASAPDLVANTVGSTIGTLKSVYPERYAFLDMKVSYHQSANYLGPKTKNPLAMLLYRTSGDYDGETFWLTFHPQHPKIPKWLGIGLGHSADGLKHQVSTPEYPHSRVMVLGLDLDPFYKMRTSNRKWTRFFGTALSLVRLPAPALSLNQGKLTGHWLYK